MEVIVVFGISSHPSMMRWRIEFPFQKSDHMALSSSPTIYLVQVTSFLLFAHPGSGNCNSASLGASEMVQHTKVLAAKFDHLSLTPGTPMVEREH